MTRGVLSNEQIFAMWRFRAKCATCGRLSSCHDPGARCEMPQPSGPDCAGVFRQLTPEEQESEDAALKALFE